jgi:hypothetical protein
MLTTVQDTVTKVGLYMEVKTVLYIKEKYIFTKKITFHFLFMYFGRNA